MTGLTRRPSISPSTGLPRSTSAALKIGYVEESQRPSDEREELKVLRELGFELVPIALPKDYPLDAITLMLGTEAAAVFDEFTRNHVTEGLNSWPETFRQGQFVPAVEYLPQRGCARS